MNLAPGAGAGYGDLVVKDGDLLLTADAHPGGTNPVLQDIVQSLRTFLGEWYLDTSLGVPWFQSILVKGADLSLTDAILQRVVQNRPGVTQLLAWRSIVNRAGRFTSVAFTVNTTRGIVTYDAGAPV